MEERLFYKVAQTRLFVRHALAKAQKPAVLCSFGKDSMTVLHFVREQRPDVPVIYFRAFDHPTKHKFADEQIKALNLNIVEPLPYFRDVISNGKSVQLIEAFAPGINFHFPIESEAEYLPDSKSHCAVERLQAPTDPSAWEYDCLFIGHRGDDIDAFWGGEIGAHYERVEFEYVEIVYPLLYWTEADIWEASRELNIPQNEARYSGDLSANNDYYPLCTNCLKPTGEKQSYCPKTGLMINNIAEAAGVEKQREIWQSRFVNIRSQHARH